jgi:hypothetical protein
MKKVIELLDSGTHLVTTPAELLALNMKLSVFVDEYNTLVPSAPVKKFTDKTTAAKRLFAVLPAYVELVVVDVLPLKKTSPRTKASVSSVLRELYADITITYSQEQLLTLTAASYKVLHDNISRLKNLKYAGKAGLIHIVKGEDGLYGLAL